jgi:uncharacterized protein (DUF697 family)
LWSAIEAVSTLGLQAMLRGDAGVRDAYERAAHPHIVGHALAAAGVGALPLVDLVGVPAVQAKLLHGLGRLYGQIGTDGRCPNFSVCSAPGIGAGYLARTAGRELIKLVPWWGQTVGAMWGATTSGATTYALGKAAGYYFAHRGRRRFRWMRRRCAGFMPRRWWPAPVRAC